MIALTVPAIVILLVPIIVVEGLLYRKWLGLNGWRAMKSSAVSNALSTVFGVPAAWVVMLGVEFGMFGLASKSSTLQHALDHSHSPLADAVFLFLGSAWIGPAEGKDAWLVPAASLALLVPFFFASYGIEYLVLHHMIGMPEGGSPNLTYPRVRIAVRNANLVTYGAIFLFVSVWLITLLPH